MCTTLNLGTMTFLGWGRSSLLQYSFTASQSMIAVTHPTNSAQRANIDTSGPNLVTDVTKGISNLQEVKDSFNAAWQWATKEGVMCDENMRGIRYNLQDITPRVSTPFYWNPPEISTNNVEMPHFWTASNKVIRFQFFFWNTGGNILFGHTEKISQISQWTRPQHLFCYLWPSRQGFIVMYYDRVFSPPKCCHFFSLFVPTHNFKLLTGTFFFGAGLFATKKE